MPTTGNTPPRETKEYDIIMQWKKIFQIWKKVLKSPEKTIFPYFDRFQPPIGFALRKMGFKNISFEKMHFIEFLISKAAEPFSFNSISFPNEQS